MPEDFRAVFRASSRARLHERPAHPPALWRFPIRLDGDDVDVWIHDLIDESPGYPNHIGLEAVVDLPSSSVDDAAARAFNLASFMTSTLSASARSPIGPPQHHLAYQLGGDAVTPRELRCWLRNSAVPTPKTSIPGDLAAEVVQRVLALEDPVDVHRVSSALQMYVTGLKSVNGPSRLMLFWPACEGLDRPLRRVLDRRVKDRHWGLKALAESIGETPQLIDDAYGMRNDFFHVRVGEDPPDARLARCETLADRLETLLVPALRATLGISVGVTDAPHSATTDHPAYTLISATIVGDPELWSPQVHPYIDAQVAVERGPDDPAGLLNLRVSHQYTPRNMASMVDISVETWGPATPNRARWEGGAFQVIRGEA